MSDAEIPSMDYPHPAPQGTRIYHWRGGLLLLAHTLVLDRPTNPIAATLRIALNKPYVIEVEDRKITTRASLVGSGKVRKRVTAIDSDVALFYFPIEWPEYSGLRRAIGDQSIVDLDISIFKPVLARLREAFNGNLDGDAIRSISQDTLRLIAPEAAIQVDPRIAEVSRILSEMPLGIFSVEDIAKKVHLSPSRLRGLFKEEIGYPIGEYARWAAMWRAMGLWTPGITFTDAALEAGFYDLAHADKTFVEMFGMSPSLATDQRFVTKINCDLGV